MPSSGMWRCVDLVCTDVPPKRLCTQYIHGATSKKKTFFIVTAVKTSNVKNRNKTKCYLILFVFYHKPKEGQVFALTDSLMWPFRSCRNLLNFCRNMLHFSSFLLGKLRPLKYK
jgi:hypothetical protein